VIVSRVLDLDADVQAHLLLSAPPLADLRLEKDLLKIVPVFFYYEYIHK
jgi:hypothetical protein